MSTIPSLIFRKDIWTHFPVIVVPLGRGTDGAERHAIIWNRKKLTEWRASARPETWLQHESVQHERLIQGLHASTKWTVEMAANPDHICVIRMKYAMSNKHASNYEAPIIHSPVLTRLTDIKAYFPVVWRAISNNSTKSFALELHRNDIAKLSAARGQDVEDQIVGILMRALKASTAWRVLQPVEANEFCRLEMLC